MVAFLPFRFMACDPSSPEYPDSLFKSPISLTGSVGLGRRGSRTPASSGGRPRRL